jgi:hypothetical protein
MLYNVCMFLLCFPISVVSAIPNILYPKYVYNNKKLERFGQGITIYLIYSSFHGLFSGSYYYFSLGCYVQFFYLMLHKSNTNKY